MRSRNVNRSSRLGLTRGLNFMFFCARDQGIWTSMRCLGSLSSGNPDFAKYYWYGIVTVIRYTATAIIFSSLHFQNVIRC